MVTTAARSRPSPLPYAMLALAGTFWGLGFPLGKMALGSMPVPAMVTFRLLAASLVLLPVAFRGGLRIERRDVWKFVVASILYVPVQFLVQFEGLAHTSVAHAALMVATAPIFLAFGAMIFHKDHARPKWIPIAASCIGAAIVVLAPSGNASAYGDTLVVISLLAGVSWVLLSERFISRYDAVAASALMIWIGTAVLTVFECMLHPHALFHAYPLNAWLATLGAGAFSSAAATVFWNAGLQRVRSSDAGVFINLEPLVGTICGIIFFGDPLTWTLVFGGALIICGAVMITRSSS